MLGPDFLAFLAQWKRRRVCQWFESQVPCQVWAACREHGGLCETWQGCGDWALQCIPNVAMFELGLEKKKNLTELAKGKNRRWTSIRGERCAPTPGDKQQSLSWSSGLGARGMQGRDEPSTLGSLETRGAEIDSAVAQRQERPFDSPQCHVSIKII